MRKQKHVPKRLRATKAERRRRRAEELAHPEMAGLYGLEMWQERVVKLKRRRRWARRGSDYHLRVRQLVTGTIGGRPRNLPVLRFDAADPFGDQSIACLRAEDRWVHLGEGVCVGPDMLEALRDLYRNGGFARTKHGGHQLLSVPQGAIQTAEGQLLICDPVFEDLDLIGNHHLPDIEAGMREMYRQASLPPKITTIDPPKDYQWVNPAKVRR